MMEDTLESLSSVHRYISVTEFRNLFFYGSVGVGKTYSIYMHCERDHGKRILCALPFGAPAF